MENPKMKIKLWILLCKSFLFSPFFFILLVYFPPFFSRAIRAWNNRQLDRKSLASSFQKKIFPFSQMRKYEYIFFLFYFSPFLLQYIKHNSQEFHVSFKHFLLLNPSSLETIVDSIKKKKKK